MPWNRRQLADLVGTTANTVRHYHRVGLLDEPSRRLDGQRRYEVRHLVRLLHVRRLAHLGVPLHDIAEMGSEAPPSTMLRSLETELTDSIAHLLAAREDLATMIGLDAPYDAPAEFAAIAGRLTAADRALTLICSRLISAGALDAIREQFTTERTEPQVEFDSLPSRVDDVTVGRLAKGLAPHPVLAYVEGVFAGADANTRLGDDRTRDILLDAVVGVHNAAQLEVLRRMHPLLDGWLD
ncbi:MerR family transcriptional regulator [Rhodococcus ruber]|uniref:MerR family transcriptional regulator n=1 Tax=Rhodococcus ruber TaxID=1830 RepID=A0ABT4MHM9_9NOCA|nr:MerR family transcriptional regulator [Rhodococcus ruber]MCZ4520492.1 MerR family transcriptional regulator [Rhodococcus ruber]